MSCLVGILEIHQIIIHGDVVFRKKNPVYMHRGCQKKHELTCAIGATEQMFEG